MSLQGIKMTDRDLNNLSLRAYELCERNKWERDWRAGLYLHLEASEFIESLRGKHNENPISEAADVLFVLTTICESYGFTLQMIIKEMESKVDKLYEKEPYK